MFLCSVSFGSSRISIITGFETDRKTTFKLNLKTLTQVIGLFSVTRSPLRLSRNFNRPPCVPVWEKRKILPSHKPWMKIPDHEKFSTISPTVMTLPSVSEETLNVLKVNLEILINWHIPRLFEYQLISSASKALQLLTFTSNCENTYLNKTLRQIICGLSYLKRWNRPLLVPKVTTVPLVEQKTCLRRHCQ